MDNYKIKVKDEAESKEAQELFFELGYAKSKQCQWLVASCIQFLATDGECLHCWDEEKFGGNRFESLPHKELTLPQLRDLVVLKRGDVRDATHEDQYGDKWLYLDERHYVYLNYQWGLPTGEFLERYELKPIEKSQPQDPALISGAEALRALADGKWVIGKAKDYESGWHDAKHWTLTAFLEDTVYFKLKPQTIKLELELPKPFEPKEGDEYFYISTLQHCLYSHDVWSDETADITQAAFGAYRTEAEVKQVVEQLRKIRGTNS